jgi:phosphoribosyl-AMP cyclohydrolase / phosphoribosyl-ATP pyrophosphohydrolase
VTGTAESAVSPTGLQFDADGLIPAVVQEVDTGEVLMVAWMNAEALAETLRTRRTHFWSRSRRTLWRKGDTSGHRQHVAAVYADCDRDTLLVLVQQEGVACHTGSRTCFFATVDGLAPEPAAGLIETRGEGGDPPVTPRPVPPGPVEPRPAEPPRHGPSEVGEWVGATGILDRLGRLIEARKVAPPAGSYVARLLAGGDAQITKKIGEEAAEVIVAAVSETPARLVAEVADLWFHTLVLLGGHGLSPRQVLAELARRHRVAVPAAAVEPDAPDAGAASAP